MTEEKKQELKDRLQKIGFESDVTLMVYELSQVLKDLIDNLE
jgi:DNA recombination-dependent growth factor C